MLIGLVYIAVFIQLGNAAESGSVFKRVFTIGSLLAGLLGLLLLVDWRNLGQFMSKAGKRTGLVWRSALLARRLAYSLCGTKFADKLRMNSSSFCSIAGMDLMEWLLSEDVLQTLFDGLLGASVGAGVAVVVLRLTLREQRQALTAQLNVQRDENARIRMHDVVASILSALIEGRNALLTKDIDRHSKALYQFHIDIERFLLDLSVGEEDVYRVFKDFGNAAFRESRKRIDGDPAAAELDSLIEVFHWVGAFFVKWVRTDERFRKTVVEGGQYALARVQSEGMDEWAKSSTEEKLGPNYFGRA